MDIYFPPLLAPLETNSALGIAAVMHRLHTVHFCMAVLQDCFFEGKVRKNFLENGSREVGSGIVYSGPRIWRLEVPLARKIPESRFFLGTVRTCTVEDCKRGRGCFPCRLSPPFTFI